MMDSDTISTAVVAGGMTAGYEYFTDEYGEANLIKCGLMGAASSFVGSSIGGMFPGDGPIMEAVASGATFAAMKKIMHEEETSVVKDVLVGAGIHFAANTITSNVNLPFLNSSQQSGIASI